VSRLLTPCSDGDHITPQDAQACSLQHCKLLAISYVLPSCYLWRPPSNPFASNKVSSSTRCAWYVRHSQDFLPRAQYMYKKHFHDAKSWPPPCCISPAPVPSAIALLHRKWLKRTHGVLNFWISRNLKSWSHIFKFLYITQFSYKRKLHNPRASAIKVGSAIFINLRRHRGLDFHFITNSRVDIYTQSSTVEDGNYRVVEVRILKSGTKYQPKLIINIINQR